jgi:hypothetical protein
MRQAVGVERVELLHLCAGDAHLGDQLREDAGVALDGAPAVHGGCLARRGEPTLVGYEGPTGLVNECPLSAAMRLCTRGINWFAGGCVARGKWQVLIGLGCM